MGGLFQISRIDGRSNAEVVLDYVRDGEPGKIYTYDELAAALGAGTEKAYTRTEVQSIVSDLYPRLLKEQQRALRNVRHKGYRLAHASDHNNLALMRTKRADVQMLRGVQTLQNVRWDELDPEARKVHEGTLLVVGAMYQQQQAMDKRLHVVERAIRDMKGETQE